MTGLGDRWDELPEALQPHDDEAAERPIDRLAAQRDAALAINVVVGLACFFAGAGFLVLLQRLGGQ